MWRLTVQLCLLGLCIMVYKTTAQPTFIDSDFCQNNAILQQMARTLEILTEQTKALTLSISLLEEKSQRNGAAFQTKLTQFERQYDHMQGNFSARLKEMESTVREGIQKTVFGLKNTFGSKISNIKNAVFRVAQNQSITLKNILRFEEAREGKLADSQNKLLSSIGGLVNGTLHKLIASSSAKLENSLDKIYDSDQVIVNEIVQSAASVKTVLRKEVGGVTDQMTSVAAAIVDELIMTLNNNTRKLTEQRQLEDNLTISENLPQGSNFSFTAISSRIISLVEILRQGQSSEITSDMRNISREFQVEVLRAVRSSEPNLTSLVTQSDLDTSLTSLRNLVTDGEVCPRKFIGDLLRNAVRIQVGTIRLVNGTTPYNGRVELFYQGKWGSVCDDGWGNDDAKVVCRQLGLCGGVAVPSAGYGKAADSAPIYLDDMACSGSELTLLQCRPRTVGSHNCGHAEDAGARCTLCS